MESSNDSKKNFFKHVFNFDDDSKSEILNIIQYAIIAIIPVILLNKTMSKYVPEADDKKGSVEILAEIMIQTISMFLGLLIIHRIITYIPTYSGEIYPEFNIIFIVLAVLMITMSLQTKLGEKVGILFDRVSELWNGKTEKTKVVNVNGKNVTVKVTQPISGQNKQQQMQPAQQSQNMYSDGTSISSLPMNSNPQAQYSMPPQKLPDYDNMYRQDTTPLVGASMPGQTESLEPMAANGVLGGFGSFSSW